MRLSSFTSVYVYYNKQRLEHGMMKKYEDTMLTSMNCQVLSIDMIAIFERSNQNKRQFYSHKELCKCSVHTVN